MSKDLSISVEHSRDNSLRFFELYTRQKAADIVGKTIIDLSAGKGYISYLFEQAGAVVMPFDLFPNQNTFTKARTKKIDLQKEYPIENSTADVVILSETIEHLPNQFFFFQETARILKSTGKLFLTTPNTSSLRSRLAQFMMESEHYSSPAPNELNAFVSWSTGDSYFGKLFLSGVLRLRTLAAINKLKITAIHSTPVSFTSVFWLILLYPFVRYFNYRVYRKEVRSDAKNKSIYQEIFTINTSFKVLTSKHLILEFDKHTVAP